MTKLIRISDPSDIVDAIQHLIDEAIDNHDNDTTDSLENKIEQLESDVYNLQEIANDRLDRIEYLEGLLKENGIEY